MIFKVGSNLVCLRKRKKANKAGSDCMTRRETENGVKEIAQSLMVFSFVVLWALGFYSEMGIHYKTLRSVR